MKTPHVKSLRYLLIWICCLSALSGCTGPLVLNVEDTVVLPDRQTHFCAWLGQGRSMGFKKDIRNATVLFYVDGAPVAQAVTDREGLAAVSCMLPRSQATHFEAKAQFHEIAASTQGNLFRWSNDKTIVAVDIDGTISNTDYSGLFVVPIDRHSKPIGNSPEVLADLAKDYQIYYLSARPKFLYEKTRQWLKDNDFPPGPVAHATKFEACIYQESYKRKMLAVLRERYPNMLIGIGDKGVDDKAFGANNMLTLLVNYSSLESYSPKCVLCKNWNQVNRIFATNRGLLTKPEQLFAVIDEQGKLDTGSPVVATHRPILVQASLEE